MGIRDIYSILAKNVGIKFIYPNTKQPSEIDFDYTKIQYVRLNNLSHYVRYPEYIEYTFVCPVCGTIEHSVKNVAQPCPTCLPPTPKTKLDYNISLSKSCFIYMIDYNQEQYVARSLEVLPLGDFKAAVMVIKDKNSYTLFIIATAKPDKPRITLKFEDRDILPQLTTYIDKICLDRIDKQIYGLNYYKYAILLSYVASLAGMVNYNVQILGAGGTGKTSTARMYTATITEKTKCQDATNLSAGSGMRGSTQNIRIGDKAYLVHEPGILERYKIVTLDELPDMGGSDIDKTFLKSNLSSATLTVEVASNRAEIPKNATVIGTGNVPRWVKVKRSKMIDKNLNPEIEFELEGRWHVDGQNLNYLDRFALLFYLDASEVEPDFNANDQNISDIELRQRLYAPEIDNYLKVCANIKVNIPEGIKKQMKMLSTQTIDPIHSTTRRNIYISMTVQLHAMINQRGEANMDDIRFVRQMLRKCFHPVTVGMLSETYEDDVKPLDIWALKTILVGMRMAAKEQIRKEASRQYDMTEFDSIFEHAIHYNEITKLKNDMYRCSGMFD